VLLSLYPANDEHLPSDLQHNLVECQVPLLPKVVGHVSLLDSLFRVKLQELCRDWTWKWFAQLA
jgi:hypothetical protein